MTRTYADQCIDRAEKATEGPWKNIPGDSFCAYPTVASKCKRTFIFEDHSDLQCSGIHSVEGGYPGHDEDAEFIAHARIDVPELAKRLKKACDFLRYVDGTTKAIKFADELEAPLEEK